VEGRVTRFHESQRFHGAIFAVLLASIAVVAVVTVLAAVSSRPVDAWLGAIGPAVIALVVLLLLSLSHLDVDVTDEGIVIAFRYVWPARRIAFGDIVGLEVKRYRPLLDYGGWGVRLGPAGWAYSTGGSDGVKLRLRKGIPVLIGSAHARELEAAIRAGMEGVAAATS